MNVLLLLVLIAAVVVSSLVLTPWVGGAVLITGMILLGILALVGASTGAASDASAREPVEPVGLPGPGDPDSGVD